VTSRVNCTFASPAIAIKLHLFTATGVCAACYIKLDYITVVWGDRRCCASLPPKRALYLLSSQLLHCLIKHRSIFLPLVLAHGEMKLVIVLCMLCVLVMQCVTICSASLPMQQRQLQGVILE
jgi:hypothetical protein